jgi:hypothetical protein
LQADDLFSTPLNQAEIDFENEGGETYVCGNPPYLGSQWRNVEQQSEMHNVFAMHTDSYKDLDYVAAWFLKVAEYGQRVECSAAFVATKSINQGRLLVCPANFVPVAMIGTGSKGAVYGTREEAWSRTGGEPVAAD